MIYQPREHRPMIDILEERITRLECELRRLHVENETLRAALRRAIRTYMVADDALDPDAQLECFYQREIKGDK